MENYTLYCIGIPCDWREVELQSFFSSCGNVLKVNLLPPKPGKSKAFAFIVYETKESLLKAISDFKNNRFGINVSIAENTFTRLQKDSVESFNQDILQDNVKGTNLSSVTEKSWIANNYSDFDEIVLTHVVSPTEFYGIHFSDLKKLENMNAQLEENVKNSTFKLESIKEKMMLACSYQYKWQRARVTKVLKSGMKEVFLIDSGKSTCVSDLRAINSAFLNISNFAFKMSLTSDPHEKGAFSFDFLHKFEERLQNNPLATQKAFVKVICILADNTKCVTFPSELNKQCTEYLSKFTNSISKNTKNLSTAQKPELSDHKTNNFQKKSQYRQENDSQHLSDQKQHSSHHTLGNSWEENFLQNKDYLKNQQRQQFSNYSTKISKNESNPNNFLHNQKQQLTNHSRIINKKPAIDKNFYSNRHNQQLASHVSTKNFKEESNTGSYEHLPSFSNYRNIVYEGNDIKHLKSNAGKFNTEQVFKKFNSFNINSCDEISSVLKKRCLISKINYMKIFITYVVNPIEFYGVLEGNKPLVEKLSRSITDDLEKESKKAQFNITETMVACYDCGVWKRGNILSKNEKSWDIFLIDEGKVVVISHIKLLPEKYMQFPALSEKLSLSDVSPPNGSYSNEDITNFKSLLGLGKVNRPVTSCKLVAFDDENNVKVISLFAEDERNGTFQFSDKLRSTWNAEVKNTCESNESSFDSTSLHLNRSSDEISLTEVIKDDEILADGDYVLFSHYSDYLQESYFIPQKMRNDLDEILSDLNCDSFEMQSFSELPKEDSLVVAKYSSDNLLYRATVQTILSPKLVLVHFIDFGNVEEVRCEDIFKCSDSLLKYPHCAILLQYLQGIDKNKYLVNTAAKKEVVSTFFGDNIWQVTNIQKVDGKYEVVLLDENNEPVTKTTILNYRDNLKKLIKDNIKFTSESRESCSLSANLEESKTLKCPAPKSIKIGEELSVIITGKSPHNKLNFFFMPEEKSGEFRTLSYDLNEYINKNFGNNRLTNYKPEPESIFVCLKPDSKVAYRARCLDNTEGSITCQYIDRGNIDESTNFFPISEKFLEIPEFCYSGILSGNSRIKELDSYIGKTLKIAIDKVDLECEVEYYTVTVL